MPLQSHKSNKVKRRTFKQTIFQHLHCWLRKEPCRWPNKKKPDQFQQLIHDNKAEELYSWHWTNIWTNVEAKCNTKTFFEFFKFNIFCISKSLWFSKHSVVQFNTKSYLGACQTSMMELFVKITSGIYWRDIKCR